MPRQPPCGDPKIWKGNKLDYAQTDRSGVAGGIDSDENTPDDRTAKCHWKSRRRFPIYIYSTINIFCSAADINELVEMFKGETGETEEQKEAEYSEKTQDQWETQDEMRSE